MRKTQRIRTPPVWALGGSEGAARWRGASGASSKGALCRARVSGARIRGEAGVGNVAGTNNKEPLAICFFLPDLMQLDARFPTRESGRSFTHPRPGPSGQDQVGRAGTFIRRLVVLAWARRDLARRSE